MIGQCLGANLSPPPCSDAPDRVAHGQPMECVSENLAEIDKPAILLTNVALHQQEGEQGELKLRVCLRSVFMEAVPHIRSGVNLGLATCCLSPCVTSAPVSLLMLSVLLSGFKAHSV